MEGTVLNVLYIISLNPQNNLGYRRYYHSHFLFKETLRLSGVRRQDEDLNQGHLAPGFAPHDLVSPPAHFISE